LNLLGTKVKAKSKKTSSHLSFYLTIKKNCMRYKYVQVPLLLILSLFLHLSLLHSPLFYPHLSFTFPLYLAVFLNYLIIFSFILFFFLFVSPYLLHTYTNTHTQTHIGTHTHSQKKLLIAITFKAIFIFCILRIYYFLDISRHFKHIHTHTHTHTHTH